MPDMRLELRAGRSNGSPRLFDADHPLGDAVARLPYYEDGYWTFEQQLAHAEKIVLAVNCHAELVAALRQAEACIDTTAKGGELALRMVRAALASAANGQ